MAPATHRTIKTNSNSQDRPQFGSSSSNPLSANAPALGRVRPWVNVSLAGTHYGTSR